jgi:hypothetical protein
MKTLQALLSIVTLSASFLACENKDNQILGNKVAGNWAVVSIRFSNPNRPGTDSTIVPQNAQITFNTCTFKDGSQTDCPGSYQILGKQPTVVNFMASGVKQQTVNISGFAKTISPGEVQINGGYAVTFEDNGNKMDMKGPFQIGNKYDETAYYSLVRK